MMSTVIGGAMLNGCGRNPQSSPPRKAADDKAADEKPHALANAE